MNGDANPQPVRHEPEYYYTFDQDDDEDGYGQVITDLTKEHMTWKNAQDYHQDAYDAVVTAW